MATNGGGTKGKRRIYFYRCVQWNPSGTLFASGGEDGGVNVWYPHSLKVVCERERDVGAVTWLSCRPNGEVLATVGLDGMIRLHNVTTGTVDKTFGEKDEHIWSVDWSPNGDQLVTGSQFGIIRVWDIVSGKITISLNSHVRNRSAVVWHPDGKKIAASGGSGIGHIRIWTPPSATAANKNLDHRQPKSRKAAMRLRLLVSQNQS